MSRIGKKPVLIPEKCEVSLNQDNVINVRGPLGQLSYQVPQEIAVEIKGHEVLVSRSSEIPSIRSKHGLVRSLIFNMVHGVTKGYEKRLELIWAGGKVMLEGNTLKFDVNFIKTEIIPPEGINIKLDRGNKITVSGIDKQKVGEVAAKIRDVLPPEPYKQKGIRYENEVIRKKAGKAKA
ncbi:MAG TPA: 50S ribosomal protein L6 [Firmicutes bacterium]|nr:50S ribosomal protein L6 [Bacillota bacterium]